MYYGSWMELEIFIIIKVFVLTHGGMTLFYHQLGNEQTAGHTYIKFRPTFFLGGGSHFIKLRKLCVF